MATVNVDPLAEKDDRDLCFAGAAFELFVAFFWFCRRRDRRK
jgi:hypothetical protein